MCCDWLFEPCAIQSSAPTAREQKGHDLVSNGIRTQSMKAMLSLSGSLLFSSSSARLLPDSVCRAPKGK